ncbi:MAG: dCTP deaminase [Thermoplasmataceae archaeon]
MSVLSDRHIEDEVSRGFLISENFSSSSVTPNGYDIRVGIVRLGTEESGRAVVGPRKYFLTSSMEFFNFPDNVVGQIWIRSSYARKGIFGSFGFIDAGFRGNLTLSFFNGSDSEIEIASGDRIAQLVFTRLEEAVDRSYSDRSGNYQESRGIKT